MREEDKNRIERGKELNLIAVSCANAIAGEYTAEELAVLSSLFSLIGYALGDIAGQAEPYTTPATEQARRTEPGPIARLP